MLYLFGDFNDWLQHNPKFFPPRLGSSPSADWLATPRQAKKPCPSFGGKAFVGALCYKNNSYLRMLYEG
jgi:hypothetical protein